MPTVEPPEPCELRQAFDLNFARYGEIGASLSIWQDGREIVSLHGGHTTVDQTATWTSDTLIPVFSATKGLAAASFLLALYRAGLTPGIEAGELWPSFPLPHATLSEVLSHQCGLAALSRQADLFDHDDCVDAIEHTEPAWQPPQHGYHPHTFGPVIDEFMIRLTGERIAPWWEREIRAPLGIDFYLNLPERLFARVAVLYPAKADASELSSPFYSQYLKPGTRIYNSFHSLRGLGSVRSMNTPAAWTCGSPALGGVASARGMAAFYQACIGSLGGIIPPEVTTWLGTPVTDGPDLTLMTDTAFACGCMLDPVAPATGQTMRRLFGRGGFGHAGAGGSHAFAEPLYKASFAYTMNHMDLSVLPGKKTGRLVSAYMNHNLV